jgi:hypothetical protein
MLPNLPFTTIPKFIFLVIKVPFIFSWITPIILSCRFLLVLSCNAMPSLLFLCHYVLYYVLCMYVCSFYVPVPCRCRSTFFFSVFFFPGFSDTRLYGFLSILSWSWCVVFLCCLALLSSLCLYLYLSLPRSDPLSTEPLFVSVIVPAHRVFVSLPIRHIHLSLFLSLSLSPLPHVLSLMLCVSVVVCVAYLFVKRKWQDKEWKEQE